MKEVYIGDGVYVSFDGFQLILRAPKDGSDAVIYLELDLWRNLIEVAKKVGFEE